MNIWKVRDRAGTFVAGLIGFGLLWLGTDKIATEPGFSVIAIIVGFFMFYAAYNAYFVLDFQKGVILQPAFFKKPGEMKPVVNLANIEKWHLNEKVDKKTGKITKNGIVFTLKEGTYEKPSFWKKIANNFQGLKENQFLLQSNAKSTKDMLELLEENFK